jgi:membrane glycosyltransferase
LSASLLRGAGAYMGRGAWILIAVLVALGVAALTAMAMITLMEGSEYLEFAIVIVLFLAVLLGSSWFLLTPPGQQGEERDNE